MSATILLVEDEEDLASIVQYHLTKEGYTVVHASTGVEALQSLNYSIYLSCSSRLDASRYVWRRYLSKDSQQWCFAKLARHHGDSKG